MSELYMVEIVDRAPRVHSSMRIGLLVTVAALAAAVFATNGWTRSGGGHGGRSGAAHGGRSSGTHAGLHAKAAGTGASSPAGSFHHPHFHRFVGGAVFIGAPFWWYYEPPYFYGPDYNVPRYEPPTVYVEKFDGDPTPDTPGEIFCPSAGAYYPAVQNCAGGWQRVLRPEAATPGKSGEG